MATGRDLLKGACELRREVEAFIQARLPSFERPRHVFFRTSLPRYSFGKLDRRQLREEYVGLALSIDAQEP